MADTLEHAFNKVCKVFGFDSLNKHQEESIKYIVQEKKDIFENLPTGFGVADLPGFAVGVLVLTVN